ncbi:hypothetical protein NQ966_15890 [Acinetobacter baumannii]|nr:hypothetical protein [Acinetobacter baumannii]MDC5384993.1 hypothetical protein [Acinetobacter baumannii]MDC5522518.1 hypothetical protein [Acinetobacter baumannii]MDC5637832.1 hypothetical protein [Acinetobacter baumannii]
MANAFTASAHLTSTDVVEKLTNPQYESEVPEAERDTYESLSNELSNSKQGAEYLINATAGIVVGGIGGTAKTTKIDGKDVEVSTAGVGSRGELTKPYDSIQTYKDLEAVYGAENVSSTTVPKKPHQASAERSDVITDVNGGKAVQVRLEDGSLKMIPYDNRGLAIFDTDVSFTDAKLFLYMVEGAIIQCLDKNDAHEGNKALDYFLLKIGLV